MGWIKVLGQDGNIYLYSGITEPNKVLDHLLEQLSVSEDKQLINSMIKHHNEVHPLCVITGKEKILYNKEIHGNL